MVLHVRAAHRDLRETLGLRDHVVRLVRLDQLVLQGQPAFKAFLVVEDRLDRRVPQGQLAHKGRKVSKVPPVLPEHKDPKEIQVLQEPPALLSLSWVQSSPFPTPCGAHN